MKRPHWADTYMKGTQFDKDVTQVIKAVVAGMTYDPGHSDLDDVQPINIQMTLGDYRKAVRLDSVLETEI